MKKLLSLALTALLLLSLPAPARALAPNPNVRIGLYFGQNAMVSANLQNARGGGYRFGLLDKSGRFVEVARTDMTKITMVKNRNVYLSGTTYADTAADGASLVGCYHRDIAAGLSTYEEAAALAGSSGGDAFVCYINGAWGVRAGSYASSGGGQYVTGSKYAVSVVPTGSNAILFQFDMGASSPLTVLPDITGDPSPLTWFKGYRYAGGFQYLRADGNNLSVLNLVTMQDYVKGVIPYEMSPSWPLEALKAQAVCARSYTLTNLSRHASAGFDLCTETHCQVYRGANNANDGTDSAVDGTEGVYLTYGGKVCSTVYHSSDGGATENSANVWTSDVPYLKGVYDNYEDLSKATNGVWRYTYTNETLTELLRSKGYATSGVTNFYVSKFTPTGNVYAVVVEDSSGKKYTFAKEQVRTFFNAPSLGMYTHSQRYTINAGNASLTAVGENAARETLGDAGQLFAVGADGVSRPLPALSSVSILSASGVSGVPVTKPSDGVYVVDGRGWGHNVGMSQWGARGMSERGFTFEQILQYYFQGADLTNGS